MQLALKEVTENSVGQLLITGPEPCPELPEPLPPPYVWDDTAVTRKAAETVENDFILSMELKTWVSDLSNDALSWK